MAGGRVTGFTNATKRHTEPLFIWVVWLSVWCDISPPTGGRFLEGTMGLITTAEELAEAIVSDPERVAACLGRIHRFGGQVPHCTVLRHSLEVYHRIDADPDSSDAARLWALLHDCHEILTGDVVRPYVNARLRMDQDEIDAAIVRRLPMRVPQPGSMSWEAVIAADRAVGAWELEQIQQGRAPYDLYQFPAKSWADLVREFITIGGAA